MKLNELTPTNWEELESFLKHRSVDLFYINAFQVLKNFYNEKGTSHTIENEDNILHLCLMRAFADQFQKAPTLLNSSTPLLGHPFTKVLLEFRLEAGL